MKRNSKKIATLLTMALVAGGLTTGCGYEDINHAYAEVKTEDGRAYVFESYSTVDRITERRNGLEKAVTLSNKILSEKAGATATIHFVCESCGKDETTEITVPESKVFSCDCPEYDELTDEEQKECKNSKEYLSILFAVQPEEKEATTEK